MLPPYILPIFPIIIHPHPPHPQQEGENIPTGVSPPPPARAETKTWNLWVENVCPCGSVVEILLDCPGFQSSWASHNSTALVVNGDGTCSLRNGSAFAYTHANMSTISVSKVVWSKSKCNTGLWPHFSLQHMLHMNDVLEGFHKILSFMV
jgi:hypothetical protein